MTTHDRDDAERFWAVVAPLIEAGRAEAGTIMGGDCLRAHGEFLAMPHHRGPGMVVKLPTARVQELIEAGEGKPFAPAGRVFREWVLVPAYDEDRWRALLEEGRAFVTRA